MSGGGGAVARNNVGGAARGPCGPFALGVEHCPVWYGRALHVVAAEDAATATTIVVTVHEPDLLRWRPGFKRRRK